MLWFGPLLQAQAQFAPGLSLFAAYDHREFQTLGFNGFTSTFNDFWGAKLSEPYPEFTGLELTHPKFGIGFRFISTGKFGFTANTAFMYGRKKHKHRAEWTSGVANELDLFIRDAQWTMTTGVHIRNLVFLETYFGGQFRKIKMTHTTVYQDGSRSLSSEYKLNGLYTGTTASIDLGFQLGLRYRMVMLYLRWSKPMNNFPPGKNLVALLDYSTVNYPPNDFPADFVSYGTEPIGFVEQDRGVKTDELEGQAISIGIEFIFGAANDTQ